MDSRKQTFGLLNQGCLTRERGAVRAGDQAVVTVSVARAEGGIIARTLRRSLAASITEVLDQKICCQPLTIPARLPSIIRMASSRAKIRSSPN
jgi:hypothetical protein